MKTNTVKKELSLVLTPVEMPSGEENDRALCLTFEPFPKKRTGNAEKKWNDQAPFRSPV